MKLLSRVLKVETADGYMQTTFPYKEEFPFNVFRTFKVLTELNRCIARRSFKLLRPAESPPYEFIIFELYMFIFKSQGGIPASPDLNAVDFFNIISDDSEDSDSDADSDAADDLPELETI